MNSNPGPFSDAFGSYVELLLQLHRLIREGKGDEPEADTIRDQMDRPWEEMSRVEIELADGLSEDLYSIGVPRQAESAASEEKLTEFERQMIVGESSTALALLRGMEPTLPPLDVAVQRGICWKRLQFPSVAAEFFQEALRIAPHDSRAIAVVMQYLLSTEHFDQAKHLSLELLETETNHLNRLIAAKGLLVAADFLKLRDHAADAMRAIVESVAHFAPVLDDEFTRDQVKFALLALATSYEASGQLAKAIEACNQALSLAPFDPYSRELRGALRFQANPVDTPENIRRELCAIMGENTETAAFSIVPSQS